MDAYRATIDRDEDGFLKAVSPVAGAGVFTVEGGVYKRGRYKGSNPEIANWYDRKNIYIAANRDDVTETFDFDALAERLINGFRALSGIYRIWLEAALR